MVSLVSATVAFSLSVASAQTYNVNCPTRQNCTVTPAGPKIIETPPRGQWLVDAIADMQKEQRQREIDARNRKLQEEQIALIQAQRQRLEHERDAPTVTYEQPAPAALSTDSPQMFTFGSANGRMWLALDDTQRLVYIIALTDAKMAVAEPLVANTGANFEEQLKGITMFYSIPAYAQIPVSFAQRLFIQRTNGASDQECAAMANGFLKYLAGATSVVAAK